APSPSPFPEDDLDDALDSIVSDEDLANLIEGYDRVSSMKIRAFISILRICIEDLTQE
ncbi:hypothetical protein LINPERPRIM_LOCUS13057, partial [Linum perenne]